MNFFRLMPQLINLGIGQTKKKARKRLRIRAFLEVLNNLKTWLWWRRRDLNPRPSALRPRLYMFRSAYCFNLMQPNGQDATGEFAKV